jgi:hypothetical protein
MYAFYMHHIPFQLYGLIGRHMPVVCPSMSHNAQCAGAVQLGWYWPGHEQLKNVITGFEPTGSASMTAV